jgi:nucleotide-binding universal stress UspA family protein
MPISRMLVATDGSSGGSRAVTAAAEMAKALDCDLLIATLPENTLPPAKWSELARAEGGVAEGLELLETRILVEAKERAESIGVAKVRTSSGSGDVAEAIMDMARRERTDIIVVGRRGRGQLAGLLLGSVSQKLVSLAPSLVLVVP